MFFGQLFVGEHSSERSCVEEDLYRFDLAVFYVNPLGAGNGPGGRMGCKIVHEAGVVSIDERLPLVNPSDDLGEPADLFHVVVSVVELVYGTRE